MQTFAEEHAKSTGVLPFGEPSSVLVPGAMSAGP
jgi:hypothetical protein